MQTSSQIRVLIVEDNPADAELMVRALQKPGILITWDRVETEQAFLEKLRGNPDLILADYSLPQFSGMKALRLVRARGSDAPFILISGVIGEDTAVEAMRSGADDYLLKDRMARLADAASHAIERRRLRADKLSAERELTASQARTKAIVDAALDSIITIDGEGRVMDVNRAAEKTFGYSADAMAGRDLAELIIPPEMRKAHRRGLERYKATGRTVLLNTRVEVSAMRQDGSRFPVELTVVPIPQDGETIFSSHIRDISERKRIEAEVRESEERFRQLAENIREVFWLIDPSKNQLLYISPAYDQIWGRDRKRLYASAGEWTEAIHPDDRDRVVTAAKERQASGNYAEEYRILRPDGATRWIRDRAFPVVDDRGTVYRIAGVAEDITARRLTIDELRESERRFRDMLKNVELISVMLDREARITYCNDHLLGLTGWRREEVLGRDWFERFLPKDAGDLKGVFSNLLDDMPDAWHHENEILTQSGSRRLIRWNNSVLRSIGGEVIGTASIGEDITARAEAEKKITRLNRVYAVLSGINAVIVRVRNRDELFREACRIAVEAGRLKAAWVAVVDHGKEEVRLVIQHGADIGALASVPRSTNEERPGGRGIVGKALRERSPQIVNDVATDPRLIYRHEILAGGFRSVAILPLLVDDQPAGVLALMSEELGFFDDDEMKLLRELAGDIGYALDHIGKADRLNYLAYYDSLTGLPNRTFLRERLTQQLRAAEREGRKFAFLKFDIVRFHTINNTYGRDAGDSLLKQIAERLTLTTTDPNGVARVGPDVFAAFVPNMDNEDDLVRFIQAASKRCFAAPFKLGEVEVKVHSKAGIAVYPHDGSDADTLLRHAEAALRRAKESSTHSYLFYTEEMSARVAEKLKLEGRLRQAVAGEQFTLHYQPKVDLERKIVGVEALIRWQSPELGLVPPGQFISLLEETGLILRVGAWALSRAALDHRQWVEEGLAAPRIAVNVSSIQLRDRQFVAVAQKAIGSGNRDGSAPVGIDMEITESVIMENIEGTIHTLKALRELGISLTIDDFGTGYSSLAYLAKLPVQSLKIDRAFIASMHHDTNAMTLVSMIISLAHSLRLKVVAEGVETEEQARLLRLLRCDEMQGYLFARPMPIAAMTELLRSQRK